MGLLDLLRPGGKAAKNTKSALEAAKDGTLDDGAINKLVQMLLGTGIDGAGPIDSAAETAARALREAGDVEKAVDKVVARGVRGGGVGGFATSIGGFVTMPVAVPVNVVEFYAQATRMVGAIASLRGYDVNEPQVRTAVLLTLAGQRADEVLGKAGITTGMGRITTFALRKLPPGALMMVNKAIAFRLLKGVGQRFLTRLGKGIPIVGGLVGAGLDAYLMKKIADQARKEFPQLPATPPTQRAA
ncbi:MAG: EcsC family protein [Thermoleophilia bacterium]|nr:EcsC family protein [Thermoleophilia bacterium]